MPTIVKYTNKKTGAILVYESTPRYDPVTKQSRPIRKYIGREDPVTHELIPSSGKPGRPKAKNTEDKKQPTTEEIDVIRKQYNDLKRVSASQEAKIERYSEKIISLQKEVNEMKKALDQIRTIADRTGQS